MLYEIWNVLNEITLKGLKNSHVHVSVSMTWSGGKPLHRTISMKGAKLNKACDPLETTKQGTLQLEGDS